MDRTGVSRFGCFRVGLVYLAGLFALLPGTSRAHEFWLAPSSHQVVKGANVEVYAMIGHGATAESLVRRRDHLKTFLVHEGLASRELTGRNRRLPTGKFRAKESGLNIVAYESFPQKNILPGPKFDAYLRKEGLDEALESRQLAAESNQEGRELYSRFAKCLIQVGSEGGADRALGFPLEIVAVNQVSKTRAGGMFVVRVLRDGEPIPGLLVKAFCLAAGDEPIGLRTDFDGVVKVPIDRVGRWMLNAVSIEPTEDSSEADWQSLWASMTFEVPARNSEP